jgi:hypothetical protein
MAVNIQLNDDMPLGDPTTYQPNFSYPDGLAPQPQPGPNPALIESPRSSFEAHPEPFPHPNPPYADPQLILNSGPGNPFDDIPPPLDPPPIDHQLQFAPPPDINADSKTLFHPLLPLKFRF